MAVSSVLMPLLMATLVACQHVDFDQIAQDFVDKKSAEIKRSVVWWDLHAKRPIMQKKYQQYKITTRVNQTNYEPVQSKVSRPGYIHHQWYHNSGSEEIVSIFQYSEERENTYTWAFSRSIKFGVSLNVGISIPVEAVSASADVGLSMELDLSSNKTQTKKKKTNFSVEEYITVPPRTSVKATLRFKETSMSVPFSAVVHVEGWIAVWYYNKYKGHWLYFYPIAELATDNVKRDGDGLVYRIEGMLQADVTTTDDLVLKEYELQEDGLQEYDLQEDGLQENDLQEYDDTENEVGV